MGLAVEVRTLRDIAEGVGYRAADVALLAECDEATVSRLWLAPDWLDRVRGRTLQALIAMIPEVAEYATSYPQLSRLAQVVSELEAEGLRVDVDAVRAMPDTRGIPLQHLLLALTSAVYVVRGDVERATAYLPRLWGRSQDGALGAVFAPGGALVDPGPLVAAAEGLAPVLARPGGYSMNAMLSRSQLAHHVARVTGLPAQPSGRAGELNRQAAVELRSATMGALAASPDPEPAERYQALVAAQPVVRLVEEWSFPVWTGDCATTRDMSLPGSVLLRRTAAEVLGELATYGDGYVHYLTTTYIPLALSRDPTFGLRVGELRAALLARRETVTDPRIVQALDQLARTLPTGAP